MTKQADFTGLQEAARGGKLPWMKLTRVGAVELVMLAHESPAAQRVFLTLLAVMNESNAVVVSHDHLAGMAGVSVPTVKRAIARLEKRMLLEVVKLQKRGAANAYVVHERVAWIGKGTRKRAAFNARVLALAEEQADGHGLNHKEPLVPLDVGELSRIGGVMAGNKTPEDLDEIDLEQIDLEAYIAAKVHQDGGRQ